VDSFGSELARAIDDLAYDKADTLISQLLDETTVAGLR
jgi:hypothetical protein